MNIRPLPIVLVILLVGTVSAASPKAVAAAAAPNAAPCGGAAAVTRAYGTWMSAFNRRDLAGTMSFFDRSIKMSFAGTPDLDYAQLEKSYKDQFSTPSRFRWVPSFEQPMASGKLAVLTSRWRGIEDGRDVVRNRGVDVLTCDGTRWSIVRSVNYTEWKASR